MTISEMIEVLKIAQMKMGDVPIYKKIMGGQGSSWEYVEISYRDIQLEEDIDDWGKSVPYAVVIS